MELIDRKTELEAKKLELEIRELERPFYMKASFLSLFVPIFAALVTGLIGYLGNIEIQKLNKEKKRLTETTHQLVTDQQKLVSQYITSTENYMSYITLLDEYKDNPRALFTKSGLLNAKNKLDAWMMSQKEAVVLSRHYAEKYQYLLGTDKAQELMTKSDSIKAHIETIQKRTDEIFKEATRESHN